MPKTHRQSGSPDEKIQDLIFMGKTFDVVRTSKTTNIKTEKINYLYADEHYYGRIFGLLSQLKKMLTEREKEIIKAPFSEYQKDVKYFEFAESVCNLKIDSGTVYKINNVIEADITKAYYKAAFNLGFITQEFYEKCLTLDKIDRLVLIGSIATVKTIDIYEKGLFKKTIIEKNDLHRKAWFKICSYIDTCLQLIKSAFDKISKDIFLFYWVDGIYFRDFKTPEGYSWEDLFNELSEFYFFDWKFQRLKGIEIENHENHLRLTVIKANEKKIFYPSKKEIKYYFLMNSGEIEDSETVNFNKPKKYTFNFYDKKS
jgi:hypothetical protein